MGAVKTLDIDIWADVVCPWCYIGERRLLAALRERPDVRANLRWRPFQLQPDMPPGGKPWRAFAEAKFGGWEPAQAMFAQVTAVGAADGVRFAFDQVVSAPNTVDAHRLLLFAEAEGRLTEAAESLFAGYFAEGADLNDRETLVALAARAGLDAVASRELLESDEGATAVAICQSQAARMGITGVPFFVFGERYAVPGAAEAGVLLGAIDRTLADRPA